MATLATVIEILLRLIQAMLFIEAVLSWFPVEQNGAFVRFVGDMTQPLLMPVQALLRRVRLFRRIRFDFSLIVVFLFIEVVIYFLNY